MPLAIDAQDISYIDNEGYDFDKTAIIQNLTAHQIVRHSAIRQAPNLYSRQQLEGVPEHIIRELLSYATSQQPTTPTEWQEAIELVLEVQNLRGPTCWYQTHELQPGMILWIKPADKVNGMVFDHRKWNSKGIRCYPIKIASVEEFGDTYCKIIGFSAIPGIQENVEIALPKGEDQIVSVYYNPVPLNSANFVDLSNPGGIITCGLGDTLHSINTGNQATVLSMYRTTEVTEPVIVLAENRGQRSCVTIQAKTSLPDVLEKKNLTQHLASVDLELQIKIEGLPTVSLNLSANHQRRKILVSAATGPEPEKFKLFSVTRGVNTGTQNLTFNPVQLRIFNSLIPWSSELGFLLATVNRHLLPAAGTCLERTHEISSNEDFILDSVAYIDTAVPDYWEIQKLKDYQVNSPENTI